MSEGNLKLVYVRPVTNGQDKKIMNMNFYLVKHLMLCGV